MSMGEGVAFHVPAAKMKKVRVNLTSRQAAVLRKGGAITVKMLTPDGSHEISLPEADIKKLMTKLHKGVGGRVKLNGGSILQDFGRYIQPLSDAAIDRGRRELGSGMEDVAKQMMGSMAKQPVYKSAVVRGKGVGRLARDFGRYVKPLSDRAMDRGIQALDGSGMKKRGRPRKGGGPFDFLDPNKNGANKFFTQTLPNTLIDEGIPIVAGVAGSTLGSATGNPLLGLAGSMAGKELGKEAARRIRRKQGRGVLTDIAMEVGKQVAKHVAKKAVSYGAKKARQGSKYLIDRAESYGNEMIGDGIMPANTGRGIIPAGVNLRRGAGLGMNDPIIQTGSPYLQRGSAAWTPYVPSQNPFTTNTMVGRATKHGGMVVRM